MNKQTRYTINMLAIILMAGSMSLNARNYWVCNNSDQKIEALVTFKLIDENFTDVHELKLTVYPHEKVQCKPDRMNDIHDPLHIDKYDIGSYAEEMHRKLLSRLCSIWEEGEYIVSNVKLTISAWSLEGREMGEEKDLKLVYNGTDMATIK